MNDPDLTHDPTELLQLIESGDEAALRSFVAELEPLETVLIVSRLDEEHRARLMSLLAPEQAATMVEQMPDAYAAELMQLVEAEVAAAILSELSSAAQADLLGDLEAAGAEAILREMPPEVARLARDLSRYDDAEAGGLMVRELLAYPETWTVGQVVDDMRSHAEEYRDYTVQYAFVVRGDRVLVGVLRMRDLLMASHGTPIRELMIADPLTVRDHAPLNELKAFFARYSFYGVPVVDADGRLLGIIRRSAVEEARAERSEDAFLKAQGIVGGEELRTMPLLRRSRRRLAWLSINIVLNVIAASVIAFYQDVIAAVIALAVFLPIISDMSGCSGNQAVAVSMRELALGLVRPRELLRVWGKEISVGLINGVALGVLIAVVAWLWQGNPYLGLVVGAAMMLNTLVAVSIGGTVPLVLRRLGADPALASGPILTTITDMCGFFLLLGIAATCLPLLR